MRSSSIERWRSVVLARVEIRLYFCGKRTKVSLAFDEVHAPEASVTGVCLAPSTEGLLWLLRAVGFRDAYVLPVPADGYEQLRHGKRVMVAALV